MTQAATGDPPAPGPRHQRQSIFHIPAVVKRVFDQFPLVTYGENERPSRAARERGEHVLHVFATPADAKSGRPSFNPGCLRWQAYLRFADVSFRTVASSNHASPSGILPFLIPATAAGTSPPPHAIPSNKLKKWTAGNASNRGEEPEDMRYEAYTSLLDTALRKAWLYQLYLHPANAALVHQLYVAPCSSHPLVQLSIAHQLRQAAENELAKSSYSATISEADILHDAGKAFLALSTLLGDNQSFFAQAKPTILDASLFAYTHPMLDEELPWGHNSLAEQLRQHQNLVDHRNRILKQYF